MAGVGTAVVVDGRCVENQKVHLDLGFLSRYPFLGFVSLALSLFVSFFVFFVRFLSFSLFLVWIVRLGLHGADHNDVLDVRFVRQIFEETKNTPETDGQEKPYKMTNYILDERGMPDGGFGDYAESVAWGH